MNGIEKITARIETDARAEAEKLLSEGQERAAAVRAEYQAKAEAEAKAAAQTGREAAQRQAQRLPFNIVRLSFRGRPFFPVYSGGSSG